MQAFGMNDISGIQYKGVGKLQLLSIGSILTVILWKSFHYIEIKSKIFQFWFNYQNQSVTSTGGWYIIIIIIIIIIIKIWRISKCQKSEACMHKARQENHVFNPWWNLKVCKKLNIGLTKWNLDSFLL